MKKIWLLLLLFFTGICFSETNLEIATRYYNKDDYENALQYYKSAVMEEHEVNGTTLYRLAYTCEKTGAKKSLYSKYYSAAAYCFEIFNFLYNLFKLVIKIGYNSSILSTFKLSNLQQVSNSLHKAWKLVAPI